MVQIYTGANLTHICYAKGIAPNAASTNYNFSLSVTGGGLTSIAVASNVGTVTTVAAHGLLPGNLVTVSGGTVDTDINSTYYVQSVPSTTTFTITTSLVSDGTYNNGALTVSGSAPLLTKPIWSIQHLNYDGSNNLTSVQWAGGNAGGYTNICANAAVTTGVTKVTYK
jgi:hypothetical protein